ncbi:YheC/YheD family protein [Paenibacillus sp. N3/727]|uniref:YheC/YheD family endospore coat-associated protein n=1 Tax=Paenibacillus sp. N3/727 TaxID=2925845 RepID=UPI001F532CA2|nr:YheC/YheD family protein [Paenibacillus sp. N3/727]UNK17290.1 YheC/YheD family protein [Paenibacillus sp. N3/727]
MTNRLEDDTKPVVAILTMHDSVRLFRGNRQNFHEIIKTGKDMGYLVYVVTVRDLKLKSGKVRGFTPGSDPHSWEQRLFPLPRVIYNRIPYREDEMKPQVRRKIKECMRHPNMDIYNPFFFNKRRLFSWLGKSRLTRKWAPVTKKLKGLPSLYEMIRLCSYLYLKPEEGKAGQGIMRLRYQKNKPMPYRLQIQNNKNSTTYKAATLERLWERVYKETKGEPYIIQQGIELTAVHGRAFDLRLLVQKSDLGVWGVTGIGARMAGTHSITTHVPRGGSIEDPEKLLPPLFGSEQTEGILSKVRNAAVHIAKQIEQGCRYSLGEMSMDLGLDTSGELWFFEANSRPMKFDEPAIRKRSLERIFNYCEYLIENR